MTRLLQQVSHILRMVWLLFPAILFIILTLIAFSSLPQGEDVLLMAAERKGAATILILTVTLLAFVAWYTSRLIVYIHNEKDPEESQKIDPFWQDAFPRILAYATFFAIEISIIVHPYFANAYDIAWVIALFVVQSLVYFLVYRYFRKHTDYKKFSIWFIGIALALVLILIFTSSARGSIARNFFIQLIGLWIVQTTFLIWNFIKAQKVGKNRLFIRWETMKLGKLNIVRLPATEKPFFIAFNIVAALLAIFFFAGIFSIPLSRKIGSFNIVMISFSILLGFLHIVTMISLRRKINLHFILFLFSILTGFFSSPYSLRKEEAKAPIYNNRLTLKDYTQQWIENNRQQIEASDSFPVYFVLSDGGSSRSGYWVAGALGRLQAETDENFQRHLFCISGASGGSVGNAVYYSLLDNAVKTAATDTSFSTEAREYLSSDFLAYTLSHMLGPDFFHYLIPVSITNDRGGALERAMENPDHNPKIGKLFAQPYSEYLKNFTPEKLPIFFINTTRVANGSPGVISNIKLDASFTPRLDVLGMLDSAGDENIPFGDIHLSTAAVLSSRFPYLSPAANVNNQKYFVDGGYFDNSGAGIVMETIAGIKSMLQDSTMLGFPKSLTDKLQFRIIHLSNSEGTIAKPSRLHPMLNDLFAPILTLASSYGQQTRVNNFRLKKFVANYANANCTNCWTEINLYDLGTEVDEDKNSFSMNWVISDTTLRRMNHRLDSNATLNTLIQNIKELK